MTRTERSYYLLSGGYNLAQFFIAPIYPLFLLSRGLDLFEINAVLATYGITVFLFEVPTGAVADVAGRRVSFVIGCVIRTAAYALYTSSRGFTDCLVAEFIDAIGTTFVSGALDAWAVDGIRADGDRRPTDRVFARAAVIARALMIAGGVAAGYLAEVSLVVPWFVASALFVSTGIAGLLVMREPPRAPAPRSAIAVGRTALEGLTIVRRSPILLVLCLLTLASAAAAFPVHMLWQPRLEELGASHFRIMGWVVAAMNVTSLVGSALLPRLLRRFRREAILGAASVFRSAAVALLAAAGRIDVALAGLLLQETAFGLREPVTTAWLNEHVAAAQRATVLSVHSTAMTLGASAGLVIIGLVARGLGIPAAFAVSAALFALAAPGYFLLGRVAERSGGGTPVVDDRPVAKAVSARS
ncbi:MAG TPA: MFS transporter [Candidatus Binatia bacterium]|nr:MFS transporter [Candidatus Binatia bacterium]